MNTVLYRVQKEKIVVQSRIRIHIEPHLFEKTDLDPYQLQSKKPDQNGAMEGLVCSQQRHEAQMEQRRACRPVVADWHHFDEEQDPDPHQSESRVRIHIKVKRGIRIL